MVAAIPAIIFLWRRCVNYLTSRSYYDLQFFNLLRRWCMHVLFSWSRRILSSVMSVVSLPPILEEITLTTSSKMHFSGCLTAFCFSDSIERCTVRRLMLWRRMRRCKCMLLLSRQPASHQHGNVIDHLPNHSALGHSTSVHSAPAQAMSKYTHICICRYIYIYIYTCLDTI